MMQFFFFGDYLNLFEGVIIFSSFVCFVASKDISQERTSPSSAKEDIEIEK